jgi:hypothetical protein
VRILHWQVWPAKPKAWVQYGALKRAVLLDMAYWLKYPARGWEAARDGSGETHIASIEIVP